jgi:hypothetical protein
MLGKGLTRFTDEDDFNELFEVDFVLQSCEILTWTLVNRTQTVREWVLVLEKSA